MARAGDPHLKKLAKSLMWQALLESDDAEANAVEDDGAVRRAAMSTTRRPPSLGAAVTRLARSAAGRYASGTHGGGGARGLYA